MYHTPDLKKAENGKDGISLSAPMIMELIEVVHKKGAVFRFQAKGFSMTPAIRDGDHITVSPLGDRPVGRGDVLAFRHPNQSQLLVHRVLRKKGDHVLIKGDNCTTADGWIPAENLLGIVTRLERKGKNRFWPNRSQPHPWSSTYLFIYPLWPPVRQLLAKCWRYMRTKIHPEK